MGLINLYLIANLTNHVFKVFCMLADGFYYNINFHCKCMELEQTQFDLQLCITCAKNIVLFLEVKSEVRTLTIEFNCMYSSLQILLN